jgi:hypothetical protein
VLKWLPGQEYWTEDRTHEKYSDGIFMEKIGAIVPVYPIDVKVSQNRRTPNSTYYPSQE